MRTFLPFAVGIFLVSLIVRVAHLFQMQRAPFFTLLMGDAQSYHAWAQRLAAGDWIGSDVFYQAPLYPYFLGVVYTLLGESPMTVRLCQAVIGSLACVCLALAGWRLFSRPAGIAAGLMLAFYAPAIFFDGLIQKSVLDVFLVCLALAMLSGLIADPSRPSTSLGATLSLSKGRRWGWLWVGMTLGCLTLSRENAVVLVPAILLWLLRPSTSSGRPEPVEGRWQRHLGRERLALAGVLLAGFAIVLLPVAARNKIVSGEFHLTTTQFGPNFYIGNNETASGTYQPLRFGHGDPKYERQDATELAEQATGRRLTPAEVSRYWTRRALEYIRTQPGDWLELMGRKVMLAWNAAEVADTEDQLSHADWSVPLRILSQVWHFGILAPLAFFGMWATWPRRAELALLYLLAASYLLALIAFAVMSRYRYPLVPFLILFASAGITSVRPLLSTPTRKVRALGARRATPRLVPALAAAIVFAVFCNWPMYSMAEMRAITESNVGTELQAQGKVDEAIAFYNAALARDPNDAVTRSNLGAALADKGRLDEAIAQYRTALALAPADADSHFNLGNVLAKLGQSEDAAHHYRRAIELRPDRVEAVNNLGLLLAAGGRFDDAIALFQRALAIDPQFTDAHTNLANAHNDLGAMLAQQNRFDEAIVHFRQAIQLVPEHAEAQGNLARALQIQGQRRAPGAK